MQPISYLDKNLLLLLHSIDFVIFHKKAPGFPGVLLYTLFVEITLFLRKTLYKDCHRGIFTGQDGIQA